MNPEIVKRGASGVLGGREEQIEDEGPSHTVHCKEAF